MVEWQDDERTRTLKGEWHVSWKDRDSVLPTDDQQRDGIHRLYFLLPGGTPVPPLVTLTHLPADPTQETAEWTTNPLPAIFPEQLGSTARMSGKKGVLHTLWAKSRLAVLQNEIEAESRRNVEGVGLEMALQEKAWIESGFGVRAKPRASFLDPMSEATLSAVSPASPRSPGNGRLLEKLKGLKIGTDEKEWAARTNYFDTPPPTGANNPLSPESSDVAISSFVQIKGSISSTAPRHAGSPVPLRTTSGMRSPPITPRRDLPLLDSIARGSTMPRMTTEDNGHDDELFALPMSPRSPTDESKPF